MEETGGLRREHNPGIDRPGSKYMGNCMQKRRWPFYRSAHSKIRLPTVFNNDMFESQPIPKKQHFGLLFYLFFLFYYLDKCS